MNKYIDSEIILQRKISPLIYVYVMIIIVIFLSLIIFSLLFNYKTYYNIKGIVIEEDNHYYIKSYIPLDKINYLVNNDAILINKKKYKYKIISIDSEYFTDNINTYQVVSIEINLEKNYQINNLSLDLKLQKENKKIINYIINK